jgi:protoporphyrinogen oxidase
VIGLDKSGRRVTAVRYKDEHGDHELPCDSVISSIALPTLVRMLGPMPSGVERSARRLRFRGIRLLNLLLDGPPISPDTWMYVSEPEYLMARIQQPMHRSPDMVPPGASSLMLEIPCEPNDEVWSAPDRVIYDRCLDDLSRLGFDGIRSRTREYFSSYVREGYPIYHLDYDGDRREALGHLDRFDGVVSCGRQGAFRYIFMDTAMEMGIEAARAVLSRHGGGAVAELGSAPGLHEAGVLTA